MTEIACRALQHPMGLYPIVDSKIWVQRLLKLGVKSIQLRVKSLDADYIEEQVANSIHIANQYHAQLFINDHWELAITHNAFGIHLGQEDIITADIKRIKLAGIRLGISTHSDHEIATALDYLPSYIAFGPIYHTDTKQMPYLPQGLSRLLNCVIRSPCPVVAIGGLTPQRTSDVMRTGVSGIAVLSTISQSKDPEKIINEYLKKMKISND